MQLSDLVARTRELLALQPEELSWFVLQHLVQQRSSTHRANFATDPLLRAADPPQRDACARALMEAWQFLESAGLIAGEPASAYPIYFVTRRGQAFATQAQFSEFLKARSFPRDSLHAEIADKAYPLFLRGEYETAIFQALKSVEVAVRTAAGYDAKAYGVDLMRKAFHPQTGPLTDLSEPEGEREALAHLFSGAIGRFKNPTSHRHVGITDPSETAEVLHIASHLLRVVEDRSRAGSP